MQTGWKLGIGEQESRNWAALRESSGGVEVGQQPDDDKRPLKLWSKAREGGEGGCTKWDTKGNTKGTTKGARLIAREACQVSRGGHPVAGHGQTGASPRKATGGRGQADGVAASRATRHGASVDEALTMEQLLLIIGPAHWA